MRLQTSLPNFPPFCRLFEHQHESLSIQSYTQWQSEYYRPDTRNEQHTLSVQAVKKDD